MPVCNENEHKKGINNCVTLDSATIKGAIPDLDIIA